MFKNLVMAMRPKQWTKNFLIFAALIFAERLFHYHDILLVMIAFVMFCLLSSSLYIINDIIDVEQDREHPKKSNRPFASGKISKGTGIIFSILLAIISLISAFITGKFYFFIITLIFFILNLIYSFKLKRLPILDVLSLSLSFVLRAAAGGVIINVFVSPWLIVCTFLLALFMAIGKRRGELILLEENHAKHRHVLSSYSVRLLDQMISVSTSSILIAYSLYTFTSGKSVALMCTIPFVIYGIFRYLYLVYQENRGDNPTSIFISDRPMQINIVCWLITVLIIFYWKHLYTVVSYQ